MRIECFIGNRQLERANCAFRDVYVKRVLAVERFDLKADILDEQVIAHREAPFNIWQRLRCVTSGWLPPAAAIASAAVTTTAISTAATPTTTSTTPVTSAAAARASAAAVTESAAISTAFTAWRLRTRFVHLQSAAFQHRSVQLRNRARRILFRSQLDESEPARTSRAHIANNARRLHFEPLAAEHLLQAFVGDFKRQVSYVELCHGRDSLNCCAAATFLGSAHPERLSRKSTAKLFLFGALYRCSVVGLAY